MKDPAWRPLLDAFNDLYQAAGCPPYRVLGHQAGLAHTTVHNVLTGRGTSGLSRRTVERLGRALGGDVQQLRATYDKIAASRPLVDRTHWAAWRQDVVVAALGAVHAWRAGDQKGVGAGMHALDELFHGR